jgi:hypothetical protein
MAFSVRQEIGGGKLLSRFGSLTCVTLRVGRSVDRLGCTDDSTAIEGFLS